jgi:hypothetical protein
VIVEFVTVELMAFELMTFERVTRTRTATDGQYNTSFLQENLSSFELVSKKFNRHVKSTPMAQLLLKI